MVHGSLHSMEEKASEWAKCQNLSITYRQTPPSIRANKDLENSLAGTLQIFNRKV